MKGCLAIILLNMWSASFQIHLERLNAPTIYIQKDTSTPIDYDNYDEYNYYYVINNNINILYSDKELSYLLNKEEDPFTRLPIVSCYVVKIKFI